MIIPRSASGVSDAMPQQRLTGVGMAIENLFAHTTPRSDARCRLSVNRLGLPVARILIVVC